MAPAQALDEAVDARRDLGHALTPRTSVLPQRPARRMLLNLRRRESLELSVVELGERGVDREVCSAPEHELGRLQRAPAWAHVNCGERPVAAEDLGEQGASGASLRFARG